MTCLELEQPDLATRLVDRIDNWRRGSVYADLAAHYAERGMVTEAERALALATSVVDSAEDWRKDRVKEKIARSSALLATKKEEAKEKAKRNETGGAASTPPTPPLTLDEVERRLAEVPPIAEKGDFDQIRAALFACAALHDEVFAERSSREACQRAIESAWGRLPIAVRLDVIAALVESALRHEDRSAAAEILVRAESLIAGASWLPEDRIPAVARFARLRHRAGGCDAAAASARDALEFFRRERERMVDIDRADALRPLAEATHEIIGADAALEVYRLAVHEGALNPNARPRAEDLALTLASMARVGVEPDEALAAAIQQVDEGLVAPW